MNIDTHASTNIATTEVAIFKAVANAWIALWVTYVPIAF